MTAGNAGRHEGRAEPHLILVGGGLASGLVALALRHAHPVISVTVLEMDEVLGGNHTWSFHESDVPAKAWPWLAPVVSARWEGHDVAFPGRQRTMTGGYASIVSGDLARAVTAALTGGDRRTGVGTVRLGTTVTAVGESHVVIEGGERLEASVVLDGRGFALDREGEGEVTVAYQKFFGQDLRLAQPHGLTRPVLMDARCEQREGFRFFYVLPWSPRQMLVEDTRYSDDPAIAADDFREAITRYVHDRGHRVVEVLREEAASLPLPLRRPPAPEANAIGVRGGFFHPTTGYSFPDAARVAQALADLPRFDGHAVRGALARLRRDGEGSAAFGRLLNRFLFNAARPAGRRAVMEQFYGHDEGLIQRFYGGTSTLRDRARMLAVKPAVPVWRALGCVMADRGGPARLTRRRPPWTPVRRP